MEHTATGKPRPLVLGAAVSVIIVSLLGAVAISELLPSAHLDKSEASAPKKRMAAEPTIPARGGVCASCGTVEAVRVVEVRGNGTGLGTVAGDAGGAPIGNQPARGNGALTALGAAGGALAGNEIEKNMLKRVSYRVTVRMDDGSFRTVSQPTAPAVAVGDRVRIANGALAARS